MENSIKSLIECSEVAPELKKIALNVASGGRISPSEALELYNCNELGLLGMLAFEIKKQKSGLKVFYNRNFHIEPTNVCINNCKFCSSKTNCTLCKDNYTFLVKDSLFKAALCILRLPKPQQRTGLPVLPHCQHVPFCPQNSCW